MFNWVQIWRVWRSIKHWYNLFLKSFWYLFDCVNRGVILHKGHTWLSASFNDLIKYVNIWVSWVFITFNLLIIDHYNQVWMSSESYNTSYHNAYIMAFRIDLNKLRWLLLFDCTLDSLLMASSVSFNAWFIAEDNQCSFLHTSVFLKQNSFIMKLGHCLT